MNVARRIFAATLIAILASSAYRAPRIVAEESALRDRFADVLVGEMIATVQRYACDVQMAAFVTGKLLRIQIEQHQHRALIAVSGLDAAGDVVRVGHDVEELEVHTAFRKVGAQPAPCPEQIILFEKFHQVGFFLRGRFSGGGGQDLQGKNCRHQRGHKNTTNVLLHSFLRLNTSLHGH